MNLVFVPILHSNLVRFAFELREAKKPKVSYVTRSKGRRVALQRGEVEALQNALSKSNWVENCP